MIRYKISKHFREPKSPIRIVQSNVKYIVNCKMCVTKIPLTILSITKMHSLKRRNNQVMITMHSNKCTFYENSIVLSQRIPKPFCFNNYLFSTAYKKKLKIFFPIKPVIRFSFRGSSGRSRVYPEKCAHAALERRATAAALWPHRRSRPHGRRVRAAGSKWCRAAPPSHS